MLQYVVGSPLNVNISGFSIITVSHTVVAIAVYNSSMDFSGWLSCQPISSGSWGIQWSLMMLWLCWGLEKHAIVTHLWNNECMMNHQNLQYIKPPFLSDMKQNTHKLGWMGILVTNEEYTLTFSGSPYVTNITYDAKAYDLAVCTCCVYLFSFVILAPLVICLKLFYSVAKSWVWHLCSAACSITGCFFSSILILIVRLLFLLFRLEIDLCLF